MQMDLNWFEKGLSGQGLGKDSYRYLIVDRKEHTAIMAQTKVFRYNRWQANHKCWMQNHQLQSTYKLTCQMHLMIDVSVQIVQVREFLQIRIARTARNITGLRSPF